jgi:hypothetical protein
MTNIWKVVGHLASTPGATRTVPSSRGSVQTCNALVTGVATAVDPLGEDYVAVITDVSPFAPCGDHECARTNQGFFLFAGQSVPVVASLTGRLVKSSSGTRLELPAALSNGSEGELVIHFIPESLRNPIPRLGSSVTLGCDSSEDCKHRPIASSK